ncbi:hypothetical protein HK104_005829 [Borealophlyctis nickersoniae]|nr:hypothetical protein HK104_005829 [Borealophlyctis nickersoniae]
MPIFRPDFDAESIEREYRDKKQQRWAKSKAGKECTFSFLAKEWRHRAGHSTVDNQRDIRARRLKEEGVDIAAITSSITTSKTVKLEVYLEHLRTTLHHIRTLREFHSPEKGWKFYKYRQSQKALLEMVKRVKGPSSDGLPKSKVVVAFGNAKFSPAGRKGCRRAPVEKFKKFLARHATLVRVDEFRTSRVCSKCGIDHGSKLEVNAEDDPEEISACIANTVVFDPGGGGCGEEEDIDVGTVESFMEEDDGAEEEAAERTVARNNADATATSKPTTPKQDTWDVDPMFIFQGRGTERENGASMRQTLQKMRDDMESGYKRCPEYRVPVLV